MHANKQLISGEYVFPNPKCYLIIYLALTLLRPMSYEDI